MSETIRIPAVYDIETGRDRIDITPDIARQIVALVVPEDMQRMYAEMDAARMEARIAALEGLLNMHSDAGWPAPLPPPKQDGDEAAVAHYVPCGICGHGVLRGKLGNMIEYHDCKPVPGAKLDAARKELSEAQALIRHNYEAEQRAIAERDAARAAVDKLRGLLREAREAMLPPSTVYGDGYRDLVQRIDAATGEASNQRGQPAAQPAGRGPLGCAGVDGREQSNGEKP